MDIVYIDKNSYIKTTRGYILPGDLKDNDEILSETGSVKVIASKKEKIDAVEIVYIGQKPIVLSAEQKMYIYNKNSKAQNKCTHISAKELEKGMLLRWSSGKSANPPKLLLNAEEVGKAIIRKQQINSVWIPRDENGVPILSDWVYSCDFKTKEKILDGILSGASKTRKVTILSVDDMQYAMVISSLICDVKKVIPRVNFAGNKYIIGFTNNSSKFPDGSCVYNNSVYGEIVSVKPLKKEMYKLLLKSRCVCDINGGIDIKSSPVGTTSEEDATDVEDD